MSLPFMQAHRHKVFKFAPIFTNSNRNFQRRADSNDNSAIYCKSRSKLYFLVDEIYPPRSNYVSIIQEAGSRKEQAFSSAQQTVLKNVMRAFRLLLLRQALITKPCITHDSSFAGEN